MQKEKKEKKVHPKVRVRLRAAIADYLQSLPKAELAALTKACRKRGLNVRVDKKGSSA